jgi:uncharacterized protein YbaR (Trm112 family)
MISPEFLERLRCPMDRAREARLTEEGDRLVCQRCGLRFGIKDGIANMVVEEAELPPGCPGLDQLPCQRGAGLAEPGRATAAGPQPGR